ncbi:MAG: hypothetical protein AAF490_13210 [Chloroflexota bacterium]
MKRQTAIDLTLSLLFSAALVVVLVEVGLRQMYNLIPIEVCAADELIGTYTCRPNFEYDDPMEVGYHYKPGLRIEGEWDPANPYLVGAGDITAPTERNDSFWFVFETDEMGFPNSEYEWRDAYDIVVLGDSFTVRTAPKTWIELLSEQSGQSILTLGAQSWGTLSQEQAIKKWGLDKNPEWVILLYFEGNDLLNVQQYLERKDSGLDWRAYDYQGVSWTRRLLTPHLWNYLLNRSSNDVVADETADYIFPMTANSNVGDIETILKFPHLLPISADYETIESSDEFKALSDSLIEIDQLVKAQNGRFLLVYVPSKEHVLWSRFWDPVDVNHILEKTVTVTLSDGDNGRLQFNPPILTYDQFNENHLAQEQLMADFAAENGIEFLNLTPIFWEKTINEGEFFHFADVHWNQAGNQLTADTIFEYIHEE